MIGAKAKGRTQYKADRDEFGRDVALALDTLCAHGGTISATTIREAIRKEEARGDRAIKRAKAAETEAAANDMDRADARKAAEEWRGLYYKAAKRADDAEALAASRKGFGEAVAEHMDARGYRFAVVYRALDGFTENRRRIVIGPFFSADARDGEVERNRRPCERVHTVERME